MGDLFVRILNISMISCYTIVVVMVLRALLLRWERKFVYFLWFVVFVNLCIPFRLEGPFSLVPAWVADFDIDRRSEGGQPVVSEGEADDLPNEVIATITYSGISHNYDVPAGGGVPGTDSNSEASFIQDGVEGKVDYLPNEQITTTAISSHEDAPDRMGAFRAPIRMMGRHIMSTTQVTDGRKMREGRSWRLCGEPGYSCWRQEIYGQSGSFGERSGMRSHFQKNAPLGFGR